MQPGLLTELEGLCDYEKERAARIAANRKKIEELGLKAQAEAVHAICAGSQKAKSQRKPKASKVEATEVRRSTRERPQVSYKENDFYPTGEPKVTKARPALEALDEAEVDALREKLQQSKVAAPDKAPTSAKKARGPVDSGKGVRIQAGKVYDSTHGVTCHWCRQKTLEDCVTCTHPGCGSGRRMPTSFCKNCLRNRHGEECEAANKSGSWVCPCCRGSCGRGCVQCCNCGPCRKKAGLEPTHQVLKCAKDAGFDNVHDYLVHLVTGETPQQVFTRKLTNSWASWEKHLVPNTSAAAPTETAAPVVHQAAPPSTSARPTKKQKQADEARVEPAVAEAAQEAAITNFFPAAKPIDFTTKLSRKQRMLLKMGLGTQSSFEEMDELAHTVT